MSTSRSPISLSTDSVTARPLTRATVRPPRSFRAEDQLRRIVAVQPFLFEERCQAGCQMRFQHKDALDLCRSSSAWMTSLASLPPREHIYGIDDN